METEFNLSDKRIELSHNLRTGKADEEMIIFKKADVKEFIKRLKDIQIWNCSPDEYLDKLNKLAGEKLNGSS